MPNITLQQLLIVAFPILTPALGSMLAAILSQDGFDRISPWINPLIAYFFLVMAAVGSAYAEGQLTADSNGLITVGTFIFSLGVGGGLHALSPWLKWLDLIQSYWFNIVKAEEVAYAKPAQVIVQPAITEQPTQQTATVSTMMQPGQQGLDTTGVQPLSISQQPTATNIPAMASGGGTAPTWWEQYKVTGTGIPTVQR